MKFYHNNANYHVLFLVKKCQEKLGTLHIIKNLKRLREI